MADFKPLGNRVVIEPMESDEQISSGGIYIPDTAVGDIVVYSKYAGTEYKQGDTEYLIVREDDILFKK